jgi:Bacterial SH3 domain
MSQVRQPTGTARPSRGLRGAHALPEVRYLVSDLAGRLQAVRDETRIRDPATGVDRGRRGAPDRRARLVGGLARGQLELRRITTAGGTGGVGTGLASDSAAILRDSAAADTVTTPAPNIAPPPITASAPPAGAMQPPAGFTRTGFASPDTYINLRTEPDRAAAIVGTINPGTQVETGARFRGWRQVRTLAGQVGWVDPRHLIDVVPQPR